MNTKGWINEGIIALMVTVPMILPGESYQWGVSNRPFRPRDRTRAPPIWIFFLTKIKFKFKNAHIYKGFSLGVLHPPW